MSNGGNMKVEIWSDVACPWCYLGESRFTQALQRFEHADRVEVVHRSFELQPGIGADATMPVLEMFQKKYGVDPAQARAQEGRLAAIAAQDGLDYSLDRLTGSTRLAHQLIHFAAEQGSEDRLVPQLFHDYFSAEGDPFTVDGLIDTARRAGLDPDGAREALEDGRYDRAVRDDESRARSLGVNGVPFFLIDEAYALSGGQSVDTFLGALRQAWTASNPIVQAAPVAGTCTDDSCEIPAEGTSTAG